MSITTILLNGRNCVTNLPNKKTGYKMNNEIAIAFLVGWACAVVAQVFMEKISNDKKP